MRKDSAVRTNVSGIHCDSILFGSKTAAMEELGWICRNVINYSAGKGVLSNLRLITSYKFFLHVFAALSEVEFGDGFLFGRDGFVAVIVSSPLNHVAKRRCWL